MSAGIQVREARPPDMAGIAIIVNHFIESSTVNFRTRPQTAGEWHDDWKMLGDRYPWLVAVDGDDVAGVAYAGPWKTRDAYDWCAESTVYVAAGRHRRGIGKLLYDRLLGILDAQGYRTTVGVISLPNPSSAALHEACGFRHTGTLEAVGYKHGRWCDVGFWQRVAEGSGAPPNEILPVAAVRPGP